jgi:hypothetical protein
MNNALQRQPIDGQVVPINDGRSLTAVAVREHVNLIQEVMRAVMKEGTHYGVIPGCKQPSLYKAGSEVLLTTFRIKYGKSWEDMQVRTEPADVANTVLKMAKKRAQIDLTLTATAASDIFTQDVEDLPEELLQEYEPTPEERLAQRKATHDAAFAKHSESVTFIKDRIAAKDMAAVAKEWAAIPQDDQMALWLANTKGGCFTTEERRAIKEDLPKAQTEPEPA